DPAQPYGAALPWPETAGRPARAAGAYVVLFDGRPVMYLERGGKSLVSFPGWEAAPGWVETLQALVKDGQVRKLEIAKVDGEPIGQTPVGEALTAGGFSMGYKGLSFRA
ncbi:MAG: hypothetical protein HKN26_07520, partial [Acidimicrobiales bacterium]|nr:hypothetical protein [Acidimicrobiales bacterium]